MQCILKTVSFLCDCLQHWCIAALANEPEYWTLTKARGNVVFTLMAMGRCETWHGRLFLVLNAQMLMFCGLEYLSECTSKNFFYDFFLTQVCLDWHTWTDWGIHMVSFWDNYHRGPGEYSRTCYWGLSREPDKKNFIFLPGNLCGIES